MDKGERAWPLGRILTASVMRLYVNELQYFLTFKSVYFENCFRYEATPKKVASGSSGSSELNLLEAGNRFDAEVIALPTPCLKQLGSVATWKIGNLAVIRTLLRGLQPEIVSRSCGLSQEKNIQAWKLWVRDRSEEQLKSNPFQAD